MRDFDGKKIIPSPKMKFGIYGIKELMFTFKTEEAAKLFLKMLQAPPDGPAREAAKRFKIREIDHAKEAA